MSGLVSQGLGSIELI